MNETFLVIPHNAYGTGYHLCLEKDDFMTLTFYLIWNMEVCHGRNKPDYVIFMKILIRH